MILLGIKWTGKKDLYSNIVLYSTGFSKVIKLANTGVPTKRPFPHLDLRATPYQDDCVALEVPSLCPTQGQFLVLLPVVCRIGKREPGKRHLAVRLSSPVWTVI